MPQPKHVTGLKIRRPSRAKLDADMQKYFRVCEDKLGFVPNVLVAYSFDQAKLRAFIGMYNDLMLAASGLSKLEREMLAVVVSSANRCYYCLTAHGAAVRQLSGDPELGEMLVMNWRTARLPRRQRALLEFAHKLTVAPGEVGEADRGALRQAGWSERDIWDAASVVGFFNFTNRVATAVDMMPNAVYHRQAR
ncbi:MAG TPA: peroxidase-related enzyme [Steroidobacteraceae bacterium]|nr:peroxidase-related enzyme [Steroidobacteraceae bacterium]